MNNQETGWVVINAGHPRTGESFVLMETFAYLRKKSIAKFVDGSGQDWKYWKRKYNFRCVKAVSTIKTVDHEL